MSSSSSLHCLCFGMSLWVLCPSLSRPPSSSLLFVITISIFGCLCIYLYFCLLPPCRCRCRPSSLFLSLTLVTLSSLFDVVCSGRLRSSAVQPLRPLFGRRPASPLSMSLMANRIDLVRLVSTGFAAVSSVALRRLRVMHPVRHSGRLFGLRSLRLLQPLSGPVLLLFGRCRPLLGRVLLSSPSADRHQAASPFLSAYLVSPPLHLAVGLVTLRFLLC